MENIEIFSKNHAVALFTYSVLEIEILTVVPVRTDSQIDTTMQYAIVNQNNVKSSHQRYIATEEYGSKFFANGAAPSGVLEHPGVRLLTGYKQQEKIRVRFFDPETVSVRQTEMYVEEFKAKLKKDTSYKGLWIVSFTLKEL